MKFSLLSDLKTSCGHFCENTVKVLSSLVINFLRFIKIPYIETNLMFAITFSQLPARHDQNKQSILGKKANYKHVTADEQDRFSFLTTRDIIEYLCFKLG